MNVYDTVNKTDVEISGAADLVALMDAGRQVDLYLKEAKSDEDGYIRWDVEHWSQLDEKRYMRCYSLNGKFIQGEATRFVKSDIFAHFNIEDALKVELS